MPSLDPIYSLIIGLAASIPAILTALWMKSKIKQEARKTHADGDKAEADASQVLTSAALSLLPGFRDRLGELDKEVSDLRLTQQKNILHSQEMESQVLTLERVVAELRGDAKFQSLFKILDTPAVLVDTEDYCIVDINPAGVGVWKYTYQECLALKLLDLTTEPERMRDDITAQIRRWTVRFMKGRDGSVLAMTVLMNYFSLEGKSYGVGIFRSVAGQSFNGEDDSLSLKEQLAQLAEQIKRQGKRIEALTKERDEVRKKINGIEDSTKNTESTT